MAEFPALPLWTDAYLGDTTHLSTFEHGAYLLLLIVSWRTPGGCVPDDDALLARYTRTTRDKWRKVRPILEPFFQVRDGFWHQARLQDELQHLQSRRQQQSEAGQASAVAKSLKRKNRGSTPVGSTLQRKVNGASTPISYPLPLSSNEQEGEPNGSLGKTKLLPEHVVEIWNKRAEAWGLPVVKTLSKERRQRLAARIREHPLEDFLTAFEAIERSAFLRGENKSGWRADIDFFSQKSSFIKLVEGSYDH